MILLCFAMLFILFDLYCCFYLRLVVCVWLVVVVIMLWGCLLV